ncbi:MAG: class II aldolase/adducin family protein, partial [Herminiimonas sp.]|nr:class II aldolase/adducin family protein [Herminiimonas sp.]
MKTALLSLLFVAAGALPVQAQILLESKNGAVLDDLVSANRILASQGVLDGFGHVSARSPL